MDSISFSHHVKIIDFGQSFVGEMASRQCHTPMRFRAPEIILEHKVDCRMDLWSMGCMVSSDLSKATTLEHC